MSGQTYGTNPGMAAEPASRPATVARLDPGAAHDTGLDLFITGLKNQHAVEEQARSMILRQLERLENYPELEARMRQHLAETEQQEKRIEEILNQFDEGTSKLKEMALKLTGNAATIVHAFAPDEVVKNSFANFAFENFEIASYKALITLAEATGQIQHHALLEQSLNEEVSMAAFINDNLAATTLKYLHRRAAGETAGR